MWTVPRLSSNPLDFYFASIATRQRFRIPSRLRSLPPHASSNLHKRRNKSTETGDDKTGHVGTGKDEGLFFLDNFFPLRLSFISRLPIINVEKLLFRLMERLQNPGMAAAEPQKIAERALEASSSIKVTEVLPRVKEGGAFVKFAYEPGQNVKDIEKTVKQHLSDNPIRPWFNPSRQVKTFLVNGRPWIEDLYRMPNSRIKVDFVPASSNSPAEELSQETLYSLFRRYGKLVDIKSQPTDSKELPRFAYLKFNTVRHAIRAKNCMHGFILSTGEGGGNGGTMLKLSYEQKRRAHYVWDWIVNHPRIVIPLLLAFFGTMSMAVFDPIRTFFVKAHVTRTFHIKDNKIYKWLSSQASRATDIINLKHRNTEDAGLKAIWDDRKSDIEQIQTWLMESADTFIVIQGPRGSGKKELVLDQALNGRKNNLVIDCKPIQEAKGDSATIRAAALEVGYRPVFSWMNSINSLIDLAAQGAIGSKTGFSETLDAQLAKILQNSTNALKQIALDGRSKDDKDADLGDDEYLEAHPERRPVVVVDNFLHKSQENSVVYDKISEWAAALTTANTAHVIFLTHDVSFSKSLSKALPDRVFRQISLGDCSPEVAKRFVINHLNADAEDGDGPHAKPKPSEMREDLIELDDCISTLGGRLTDLEFLARRIKTGETPKKAVREITEQSASEILKMYILDANDRKWTPEQAWLLVKSLATTNCLRYNELLLSDIFKSGGEATLQALEQAELITIVSSNGRPTGIKPGKPVYSAAFRQLTEDNVLRSRLDLAILTNLIKIETQGIDKCENELHLLGQLPGSPAEVRGRVQYLLGKLSAGQRRIEQYEKESGALKKVLQREY
ncbi:mitochondrial escape protein 2 [Lecanora helva]